MRTSDEDFYRAAAERRSRAAYLDRRIEFTGRLRRLMTERNWKLAPPWISGVPGVVSACWERQLSSPHGERTLLDSLTIAPWGAAVKPCECHPYTLHFGWEIPPEGFDHILAPPWRIEFGKMQDPSMLGVVGFSWMRHDHLLSVVFPGVPTTVELVWYHVPIREPWRTFGFPVAFVGTKAPPNVEHSLDAAWTHLDEASR